MGEVREGILPFPPPGWAGRRRRLWWPGGRKIGDGGDFCRAERLRRDILERGREGGGLFFLRTPLPLPFLGPFAARPVLLSTSFFRWPRSKSSSWQNIGGGGIFCAAAKGPSPADCRVEGGKTMRFNFPKRGQSPYNTLGKMSRRKYFPVSKKKAKRGENSESFRAWLYFGCVPEECPSAVRTVQQRRENCDEWTSLPSPST